MKTVLSSLVRPVGALALAAGMGVSFVVHAEETLDRFEFRRLLEAYVEGAEECTVEPYVRGADYETPQERRERARRGKQAPRDALEDFFGKNSRTVTVTVEPDWIDYDPEHEQADIETPFLVLPSTAVPGSFEDKTPVIPYGDNMVRRIPALLCFTRPILSFDTGTLSTHTTLVSVSRTRAERLDIVNEPGELYFTFELGAGSSRAYNHWASWRKDIPLHPALRLLSCEWKNGAGVIWRWKGRAKLWMPKRPVTWWYDRTTRMMHKKLLPGVRFIWDIGPDATDAFYGWGVKAPRKPSINRWKTRPFRRKHRD